MLLGGAAFVIRPHTAAATAKAAHDATVLANALQRAKQNVDAALQNAEKLQLERGRRLLQYGVTLGSEWTKNVDPTER